MRLPPPLPVLLRAIYGAALLAPLALSAATISTPSLGEIYTIPSWMPTSVSAANTPGSRNSAKPTRITADTYAAYAAAQEAILERAYYLCADNSGTLSDYAPREIGYWFYSESPPYGLRPIVTNLTMSASTRILPGDARKWVPAILNASSGFYNALVSLGDFTFRYGGSYLTRIGGVRPASTLWGGSTPAFPEFSWTVNPSAAVGNWNDRGINFSNCTTDFLLSNGVARPRGYFGDGALGFASWATNNIVTSPRTLTSVLSNNFARVDCRWLTNDTERIVWNRLAAADEVLAAVDRAYLDHDDWNAYLDLVKTTMDAYRRDDTTMDMSASYLYNGNVYGYTDPSGWSMATNYVAVTNQSWGTYSGVMADVTAAGSGVGGEMANVHVGQFALDLTDLQGIYLPHLDEFKIYPTSFTATFQGDSCNVVMNLHYTTEDLTVSKGVPYVAPSAPVPVSLYATAGTTFTRTPAPTTSKLNDLDVPRWPSWRAFSTGRIKEIEIASLAHFSGGNGATNEWRCAHDSPGSIGGIRSFAAADMAAQLKRCTDYIEAKTGANPSSTSYVSTLAADAIADAEATGVTVSFSATFSLIPGASATVKLVGGYPSEILNPVMGNLSLGPSVTATTTGDHTRPAASAESTSRQFIRADFDWHTLRLSTP